MSEVRATVRRWGSSLAAVIPPDVLRAEGVREGDQVILVVKKVQRPEDMFGVLRGRLGDPQKIKDAMRREDNE